MRGRRLERGGESIPRGFPFWEMEKKYNCSNIHIEMKNNCPKYEREKRERRSGKRKLRES
jgi:hypothetical protein